MNIVLSIVLIISWLFLMLILTKAELHFFKFIFGCLGMFFIMAMFGRYPIENAIKIMVTYPLYYIGKLTNQFNVSMNFSIVTIFHNKETLSYYISYECSGVIESMIYVSLLLFYPIYKWKDKLKFCIYGILFLLLMNIIRLLIITFLVRLFGNNIFFFAHVILSRIIFLIFLVVLYYKVFTKPHITNQKVGKTNVATT